MATNSKNSHSKRELMQFPLAIFYVYNSTTPPRPSEQDCLLD